MLEPVAAGSPAPRAFLRVGGHSLARQQLAVALALKCERIVCLSQSLRPEIVELQHLAESAGAQFHVIPGARPLVGLITAVDEVFALTDGLFSSVNACVSLLEQGQAVLVQPVEPGLAAGFERIDLNHAAAGAMRVPGRLVERLAELPADCDTLSSLQRIALQAGIRQREIPPPGQEGQFWTLVRSDDEAHALEPRWIRHRTRDDMPLGPARALALVSVRSFGPAMLHAGSGSLALVGAAAVAALLALGAGWFGLAALGLGLCALGWILRETAVLLGRIEHEVVRPRRGIDSAEAYAWLIDAIMVLLLAWGIPQASAIGPFERLFPPFMLLALLRILPRAVPGRWTAWLGDRSLIAAILGGAIVAQAAGPVVHFGAALAALAAIVLPRGENRLTRP